MSDSSLLDYSWGWVGARVGKLRPTGRMWPAKGIHAALQMLVNFEEKVTNFRFDI